VGEGATLLRLALHVLGPPPGFGGSESAPAVECCLRVASVVLLACSCLDRQALNRPCVGEVDHPRQALDLAHRVEVDTGVEIDLTLELDISSPGNQPATARFDPAGGATSYALATRISALE
jgi:hypothetical protein